MVYGIILNKDSFENLMELREMTEAGLMRLAIKNHDEEELTELEQRLDEMEATLGGTDEESVRAFFEADDRFHDAISKMGKNPMADKINRVVRTLTYAVRYETVSSMITRGKGRELFEAHRKLIDAIRDGDETVLAEKVRETYFETELMERRC